MPDYYGESSWYFARKSPMSRNDDPVEGRLFDDLTNDKNEYSGTSYLVREVIQNSLDAAMPGNSPVHVRFSLYDNSAMPKNIGEYVKGLRSGLKSFDSTIEFIGDVPDLEEGFLVCEDFGTRGLVGDTTITDDLDSPSEEREDFYWFWRNNNRSNKKEGELGRWGLGKSVYRSASQIGCMFGLTVRASDKRTLLMGQAVLKIHKHGGETYLPDGYWGKLQKENNIVLPFEDEALIHRFRKDWRLTRMAEPGLSVVVPYVSSDLQAEHIVQAAIVSFVIPILQNKLVVEVRPRDGSKPTMINAKTIERISDTIEWNGTAKTKRKFKPHISFFREALDWEGKIVESNKPTDNNLPSFTDQSFKSEDVDRMRTDLINGEMVAARVHIAVPKAEDKKTSRKQSSRPIETGSVLLFLKKTKEADKGSGFAVRKGMTITGIKQTAAQRNIDSLILVEEGLLSSFLGDVEGPAHEEWSFNASDTRFRKTWSKVGARGRCIFCGRIVDELERFLRKKDELVDRDLFINYFPSPAQTSPLKTIVGKQGESVSDEVVPGDKRAGEVPLNIPLPKPSWFRFVPLRGGFQVTRNNAVPIPSEARLRIKVAYDTTKGNPFAKWSEFDFDFRKKSDLSRWKLVGLRGKPNPDEGNVIYCDINKNVESFSIKATGFDPACDLVVDVREISSEKEDQGEST
ncbi:MAG: hypothetical protein IJG60_00510 [Thermoguttaceae bacterium]|nr:hypothetical protein [Thermoguttaceae bacterium]